MSALSPKMVEALRGFAALDAFYPDGRTLSALRRRGLIRYSEHRDDYAIVGAGMDALAAYDAERDRALRERADRAEAELRATREALSESLEALREPPAEKALAAIRNYLTLDANPPYSVRGIPAVDARRAMATALLALLDHHGFGGGS